MQGVSLNEDDLIGVDSSARDGPALLVKVDAMVKFSSRPAQRAIAASTWALLLAAWLVVGLFSLYGASWLATPLTPGAAGASFAVLLATIVAASFGVVHEADYLAHKLGEPYGTLILTLSIVSIEVILIASVLLGPGHAPTIGRDSIFAVLMIILNLVMGICLVVGAARHGEQEFNAQGATSYLSMIALLTTVALVLPKFTSTPGEFSRGQAVGMALSPHCCTRPFSGSRLAATNASSCSPRPERWWCAAWSGPPGTRPKAGKRMAQPRKATATSGCIRCCCWP